jgi:hypothetical protein
LPVINAQERQIVQQVREPLFSMDCRVEPGNDETENRSRFPDFVTTGLDPLVHVEVQLGTDCIQGRVRES